MSIFRISLKNAFAYRGSVIFNIVGSVFQIFISIALWRYVYSYDPQMIDYMILYVVLSNIIGLVYNKGMSSEIGSKVTDGSFALELVRPVNFLYLGYMRMLGRIVADIAMKGLPLMVIFIPLTIVRWNMIHYQYFLFFVLVVLIGHFLFSVLFALIGFISFICFEIWPFERLMSDTIRFISGSFIPLALFPEWLQRLSCVLPFRYLYSFPIELLLGTISYGEIIRNLYIMVAWLAVLFLILVLLFRKAVNIFVVQGG